MNLKERLALIKSEKTKKNTSASRERNMPENWHNILPYVWTREIHDLSLLFLLFLSYPKIIAFL